MRNQVSRQHKTVDKTTVWYSLILTCLASTETRAFVLLVAVAVPCSVLVLHGPC
jgi:hypothetical protein